MTQWDRARARNPPRRRSTAGSRPAPAIRGHGLSSGAERRSPGRVVARSRRGTGHGLSGGGRHRPRFDSSPLPHTPTDRASPYTVATSVNGWWAPTGCLSAVRLMTVAMGYVRPARLDEVDELARIQVSTWRT